MSFLSRIIGSKKKDVSLEPHDDGLEPGDNRKEGTDADVFSQPIGFIPRFPAPPRYIKVRSHGKKEKDFDRVFLAQELRGRTGVEIAQSGGRLPRNAPIVPSQSAKDGNAIWALEFSKDGKYLGAGGQDNVVRIWAVISTAEERQSHEKEEDATGREGEGMRLNAPVFKTRTVQEYEGHTASVLDLSWSKVRDWATFGPIITNCVRTTSSYHHQWTKQSAFGTSAVLNVCAASSTATS